MFKTFIPPSASEKEKALEYLFNLKFPDGTLFTKYFQGNPQNQIKLSIDTLTKLMGAYYRDNTPLETIITTGRKFKEVK